MQPPQKQKQAADSSEAVERLGRDLAALAGADWQRLHYGVAVSGGPDSMALLWLMATLLPGQVRAAMPSSTPRNASQSITRSPLNLRTSARPDSVLRHGTKWCRNPRIADFGPNTG